MAGAAKSTAKAYYNYVQFKAALQKAVGGVENHHGIRPAGNQEKTDCPSELSRAAHKRIQGAQGQALCTATLVVEMQHGANHG